MGKKSTLLYITYEIDIKYLYLPISLSIWVELMIEDAVIVGCSMISLVQVSTPTLLFAFQLNISLCLSFWIELVI